MAGALGLMTATVPMIVATAGTVKVMQVAFRRNGKAVGMEHWHFKGNKPVSHRHEGGNVRHEHKGLRGYGRTKKTLRR